jgi:hypothetical protein
MPTITSHRIQRDTRAPGKAGLVIAELVFDDGEHWQKCFEALAGEDAEARFDEISGRTKQLLLDHYDGAGNRRSVFPFHQVIEVPHFDGRKDGRRDDR